MLFFFKNNVWIQLVTMSGIHGYNTTGYYVWYPWLQYHWLLCLVSIATILLVTMSGIHSYNTTSYYVWYP